MKSSISNFRFIFFSLTCLLAIPFQFTLNGCSLILAGTDEQENTIANDNFTGDPSSSTTDQIPNSSNDSIFIPSNDNPITSGSDIYMSSASTGSSNENNHSDSDSLILVILESQTFYITTVDSSKGPTTGNSNAPIDSGTILEPAPINAPTTDISVNGEKGEIIYNHQNNFESVVCRQGYLDFSYSVTLLGGQVIKSLSEQEMTDMESFKNDCETEGGQYEPIGEGTSQCVINTLNQSQYTDPVWTKYSQAIIAHCKN